MTNEQMTDLINRHLGITDSYQAPDRLMQILYDRDDRETVFKNMLEAFRYDVTYDWFHLYFQDEHADRKKKKQDFTPKSVATLLSKLTEGEGDVLDVAAGTGGLLITKWDEDRVRAGFFAYSPANHFYQAEELSDRAIPFLLFNLAIRGMNATVAHVDSLSRKAKGVFFIQNDLNDAGAFSSINVFPYEEQVERTFNVKFVERAYPPLIESKNIPHHVEHHLSKPHSHEQTQLTLF